MNMEINRHLFAAYLGMIKSGYDLMDMNDPIVIFVCNQLASLEFDSEILDYFQYAKTNRIRVNPYYPRGSDYPPPASFSNIHLKNTSHFCADANPWIQMIRNFLPGFRSFLIFCSKLRIMLLFHHFGMITKIWLPIVFQPLINRLRI